MRLAFWRVSLALAAPPVDNISNQQHPNLAAAQRLSTQAYEKISQAQQARARMLCIFAGGYAFSRLDAPSTLGLYCGSLRRAPQFQP